MTLLATAAACTALAWLFVTLGSEVTEGELAGLDQSVREIAMANRSPRITAFFTAISALGSKPFLVVAGMAAGWWVSNRNRLLVLLVALCSLASREIVGSLKDMFGVVRPPNAGAASLAFPSGHVAGTAAIAMIIGYVAWRRRRAPLVVIPVCVALVGLMAASRIYLDKHWLSDTVGGGLLGVAIGLLCCAVYEWYTRDGPPVKRLP